MYDFQKANMWKRISAALFDFIMLVIVIVGSAFVLSTAIGYNNHISNLKGHYERYEQQYGIEVNISLEQYNALSEEDKAAFDSASQAFSRDEAVIYTYNMLFSLTLVIITFSILIAYLLLEFLVPLLFKNGQTLGKKIFGIGVMRVDGVRLTPFLLFVRSILGKYTIETMVSVLFAVMLFFNSSWTLVGLLVIVLIPIIQIILIATSKARCPIHDRLASTVTVDLASQMIFETQEDLLKFKEQKAQEAANEAEYF